MREGAKRHIISMANASIFKIVKKEMEFIINLLKISARLIKE